MSQEMKQEEQYESLEDFSETFLRIALEVLKRLEDEEPSHLPKRIGICSYLYDRIPTSLNGERKHSYLIRLIASKWPSFSGDNVYPIPDPYLVLTPRGIYKQSLTLWDKNTAYGRLRWEFVNFCIYYIESYLQVRDFSQENSK